MFEDKNSYETVACLNYYRPSIMVTVSWLTVHVSSTLVEDDSASAGRLPRQYPGCLGWGIDTASSLLNISTTFDMLGLSSACSWTHNIPTCMHLIASLAEYDSPAAESINSSALPSLYNFHACRIITFQVSYY